ncbi:MAG TPA: hypothetical protein VFE51_02665 [Verrucomicrobiae bacterium]|nr:hypothetical protein [Verrucomicrobiae bacterium]
MKDAAPKDEAERALQDARRLAAAGDYAGALENPSALLKALQPLRIEKCAFASLPTSKSGHWGVTAEEMTDHVWLRPETVAEIISGGVLRHAQYVALRDDKNPKEVLRESIG